MSSSRATCAGGYRGTTRGDGGFGWAVRGGSGEGHVRQWLYGGGGFRRRDGDGGGRMAQWWLWKAMRSGGGEG
ncbi:hypothetical protein GUJ93_ZPchr0006g45634 [Zizania palustris]|uniref:Uncharacterized protein n=1 Tax=Zizania palustris TaxID=103762 RepID=A0A8J5W1D0_ZIZPA|nr:hypothetical protein GUJ93_ZPchr0006g45634 [Zizania palustris]